jgi:hypothetical protein
MNLSYNLCIALSTEFTAIDVLAHDSVLMSLYTAISMRFTASVELAHGSSTAIIALLCPRDSQHLSCWLKISPAVLVLPYS